MGSPSRTPRIERRRTRSTTSGLLARQGADTPATSPRTKRYLERVNHGDRQEARKKLKLERKPRTNFFCLPAEIRQQILFLSFENVSFYIHTSSRCVFNNEWGWGPGLGGWGSFWDWSRTLRDLVDERLEGDACYVADRVMARKEICAMRLPFRPS
ncbi:hypothetical protein EG328_010267 [Venturia inaequalis]|uniref:Uncharacterized protein n=1 Tax=Venturia inaequalis TaxID=5025 RepID=A0A8H3YLB4_VENIN|nr:hypothetical protein EG328_010267 [Venturia inaequalis]